MATPSKPDGRRRHEPVYAIGVAAAMVTCHPQTLRMYERTGLIVPERTSGNARLYSEADLDRVRRVQSYTAMGVNLAGIEIIFRLLSRMERLEEVLHAVAEQAADQHEDPALAEELRARLLAALAEPDDEPGD